MEDLIASSCRTKHSIQNTDTTLARSISESTLVPFLHTTSCNLTSTRLGGQYMAYTSDGMSNYMHSRTNSFLDDRRERNHFREGQLIDCTAATRNNDQQAESHLLVQDRLALARLACAQGCVRPQAGVSLSDMVLGSTLCLPRKSRTQQMAIFVSVDFVGNQPK